VTEIKTIWATGRRKTSTARVRLLFPGQGKIVINREPVKNYFSGQERYVHPCLLPLELTNSLNNYDIYVNVSGGGINGQAEAMRLGISRALARVDPAFVPVLRERGLLKRDPRMVERKKYGQAKARKRFQWTKR
jgi:small subunit ribosomal protein S9